MKGFRRIKNSYNTVSYDNDKYCLFKYNDNDWTIGKFVNIGQRDYLNIEQIKSFKKFVDAKKFLNQLIKGE